MFSPPFMFWLIMILLLLFGGWWWGSRTGPERAFVGFPGILFILLAILGWAVFGSPFKGW